MVYASDSISIFRQSMRNRTSYVPHQGALCRIDETAVYVIEIATKQGPHELSYARQDFEFSQRLFAILDTESRGLVDREAVKEFVTLRCPVFWRRDDDLQRLQMSTESDSPTFDEIWTSVVSCCSNAGQNQAASDAQLELGVAGWMVFCRFIALAQYLEAKRRFSARHLQQTMRHRNAPRGSEVVVVDVPPPEPPAPVSPEQLATYEQQSNARLPAPELDLDHSLVAAHDSIRRRPSYSNQGCVKITIFGPPSPFSTSLIQTSSSSTSNLEFFVTLVRQNHLDSSAAEEIVVRRSMSDMKWLDDTFASHKVLGGTLCGRILPSWIVEPSPRISFSEDSVLNSSIKKTGEAISAAAAQGVGRIRDAAKSLFGNLSTSVSSGGEDGVPTAGQSSGGSKKLSNSKQSSLGTMMYSDSYYHPHSPAGKARQLERYLNYLLEHPALSTSFPLNTVLKASQSGLEAAKELLAEMSRAAKEIRDQTPQLDDGKTSVSFWPSVSSGDSSISPNLAWVRTAAQAAMALKVHGMLETTGMPSASARLQHASLPALGSSGRNPSWEDDEAAVHPRLHEASMLQNSDGHNFEDGVISVQSELETEDLLGDEGYDLLPLPVPAPERRILSAGSDFSAGHVPREARFHYGAAELQSPFSLDPMDSRNVYLGDISVDENIDKLREVIGSVENTLSRCLASVGAIGKAQKERQALHLAIVKGLDSWSGLRGKFISQRSLLKGVAGIDQSKDVFEEGDVTLADDISWQTSLAKSAVTAAEDVRSAVRVSRTAANAKAAASSAAFAAQTACETGKFATIDDARAAQTRASIAQSHAIHAAVVEHEAKTVKRRATLALANDVKCWNVHRKREMLQTSISYARSQHEATRRAVDAWTSLRDGFIGTTLIPSAHERRSNTNASPAVSQRRPVIDANEVTATIYEDLVFAGTEAPAAIVAVDHNLLNSPAGMDDETGAKIDRFDSDCILPFATAAPIGEEKEAKEDVVIDEKLSASMQSLIDGLMTWGGGFETDEEHFALPAGMAASIALEDTGKIA